MGINKTIWRDTVNRVAALNPTHRPGDKFYHLASGVDFGDIAHLRDRAFKVEFVPGTIAPVEMCQSAMWPTKGLQIQIAYGVPTGRENDSWQADIQDDADEIIRVLQHDQAQFTVADNTGELIRRVHDGTLELQFSGDDSRQAVLILGFTITYRRA